MPAAFDAFPPSTLTFFRRLQRNNERAWFHEHRDAYDESVRTPALAFGETLRKGLERIAPDFDIPARDALCRPNRDIRFRPEMPPYRPYFSLSFRPPEVPRDVGAGFYVSVGPARVTIIGGTPQRPSAEARHLIRVAIREDPEALRRLVARKAIKARFGGFWGGAYKRTFEELPPDDPLFVLIARRTWTLRRELPGPAARLPGFTRQVLADFRALAPIVLYLDEAVRSLT